MAVGSGVPYNQHVGNGIATTFAYGFTLLDEGDLVVSVDGVVTSAYTVAGIGNPAGGSITFDTAPASDADVLLQRLISLQRASDYQNNGDLQAATLNDDLDRLWMAVQGVSADTDSAVRAEPPDTLDPLPAASVRASTQLLFDEDGQPYCAAPASGSAADVLLQLASTMYGKGSALLGHNSSFVHPFGTVGSRLNVIVYATDAGIEAQGDYDPDADDGTDDTAALQAGLDRAGERVTPPTMDLGMHGSSPGNANRPQGTFVLAPGRHYKITDELEVPPGVTVCLNGSVIWQRTASKDCLRLSSQGLGWTFYGRFFDHVYGGVLQGPGVGTSTGRGLFLEAVSGGNFHDLTIQGFKYGRVGWEVQYSSFRDVRCFYNAVGSYMTARPDATTLASIDNNNDQCMDAYNTYYGLWLQCESASTYTRHDSSRNGVCDVLLGGQLTGQLRSFTVVNGGSGYTPNATLPVSITDASGTMAQAYAETNGSGVVTGVFSVDAGMGYVSPTISVAGGGVAATVTATISSDTAAVGDWVGSSSTSRGRNVLEMKCEHTAADRPASGYAVIVNGDTHRQNRFPNLLVQRQGSGNKQYYRWLLSSGRGTVVEFPGDSSSSPSDITNPAVSGDYSVFRSTLSQGLAVMWGPFNDTEKMFAYGRDETGAVDYGTRILHAGFDPNGSWTAPAFRAESSFGNAVVYRGKVTGESQDRLQVLLDGTIRTGAGSSAPTARLRVGTIGVSADRGDANVTVVVGTDEQTQRFATTLTTNRTVTLSSTGASKGDKFRVVRTGLGSFTLDVGGLKTIPSATAAWVDVEHDGTAWRLTGYGTL